MCSHGLLGNPLCAPLPPVDPHHPDGPVCARGHEAARVVHLVADVEGLHLADHGLAVGGGAGSQALGRGVARTLKGLKRKSYFKSLLHWKPVLLHP